jgi:hypothetical protein
VHGDNPGGTVGGSTGAGAVSIHGTGDPGATSAGFGAATVEEVALGVARSPESRLDLVPVQAEVRSRVSTATPNRTFTELLPAMGILLGRRYIPSRG